MFRTHWCTHGWLPSRLHALPMITCIQITGLCTLRKQKKSVIFGKITTQHLHYFQIFSSPQILKNFKYLIFELNTNVENVMFDEYLKHQNICTNKIKMQCTIEPRIPIYAAKEQIIKRDFLQIQINSSTYNTGQ